MPSVVVDADRLGHGVLDRAEVAPQLVRASARTCSTRKAACGAPCSARAAFATPERLATLNRIVQPPLTEAVERELARLARSSRGSRSSTPRCWSSGTRVRGATSSSRSPPIRACASSAWWRARASPAPRPSAGSTPSCLTGRAPAYADTTLDNAGTLEEFEAASRACARAIAAQAVAALAARGPVG
jgi:hypothetical protein